MLTEKISAAASRETEFDHQVESYQRSVLDILAHQISIARNQMTFWATKNLEEFWKKSIATMMDEKPAMVLMKISFVPRKFEKIYIISNYFGR